MMEWLYRFQWNDWNPHLYRHVVIWITVAKLLAALGYFENSIHVSTFFRLALTHSPTHHNYVTLALIAKLSLAFLHSTWFNSNSLTGRLLHSLFLLPPSHLLFLYLPAGPLHPQAHIMMGQFLWVYYHVQLEWSSLTYQYLKTQADCTQSQSGIPVSGHSQQLEEGKYWHSNSAWVSKCSMIIFDFVTDNL